MRVTTAIALTLLPLTAVAESEFFDSNGVQIHYGEEGAGEPVVLVHGLGSSGAVWNELGITTRLIEAGYRVVWFDVRGHGDSGKPHDPGGYGMEMSDDIARLLDRLDIGRAHVVGYSMGADLVSNFRATHANRLLTATVGGGGALNDGSVLVRRQSEFADAFARGDIGPAVRAMTPPGQPPPSQSQIVAMNEQMSSRNDMQALAALLRSSAIRVTSAEELASNEVPMLAIVGENDSNKNDVETMVAAMTNVELVVIPGADHVAAMRDPRFVEALLEFLADHRHSTSNR